MRTSDSPICLSSARAHPRGFTLIELLTVIAIIGVLAGILIPVVGRVRESARTSQCASNLRQVFNLYMLDVQENRGMTPSDKVKNEDGTYSNAYWINRIAAKYYTGAESKSITQIWGCPTQIDLKPEVVVTANKNKIYPLTYSMNRDINRTIAAPGVSVMRAISTFAAPNRTALSGDGNDPGSSFNYYDSIMGSGAKPPATPHNGKANIVFLDGHVEAINDQSLLNVPGTPAAGTKQAMFWFGE